MDLINQLSTENVNKMKNNNLKSLFSTLSGFSKIILKFS